MESLVKFVAVPMVAGACVGAVVVGAAWAITNSVTANGPVIAKVGNTVIHQKDLDGKLESSAGTQTLSDMVTKQLIDDAAAKNGVKVTTKDINNAISSVEASNGISSTSQLQAALAQSGMTMAQFKANLKTEVLAQKIAEKQVKVTDAQIQKYYNSNKATFTNPAQVGLSGIIVKTQQTANQVETALKNGTSFAAAAKKYSTDATSKKAGGALGTFSKTQLPAALQSVAFSLGVGSVSQPVKSQSGWMVIKVTSKAPSSVEPLAKVKSTIIQTLKQKSAKQPAQLLAQLAKTDKLTIMQSKYNSVKTKIEGQ